MSKQMHPIVSLGEFKNIVEIVRSQMLEEQIPARIWAHDYTLWKPYPLEISNRLGWLHCHENMIEAIAPIEKFVEEVRESGYTHALLLGMGGSSLAPEMFRRIFGVKAGYLDLAVLDSTVPGVVEQCAKRAKPAKTLYIVSTKSGGTVETISFFKYLFNYVGERVGKEDAGRHFVAITDPGSGLAKLAEKYAFRRTFLNDPDIGGRYSALSYFGLVPAALGGVDIGRLLRSATALAVHTEECASIAKHRNIGVRLGSFMSELAAMGRDKISFIVSPTIASFAAWIEQLVAESLGKEGKGVLPVIGEPPGLPAIYGGDRSFVYIRLEGEGIFDAHVQALMDANQPVMQFCIKDPYELGGEIFRWEMATAIAGHRMKINPFDQPNVESAKVRAQEMLEAYKEKGQLPMLAPSLAEDGIKVYGDSPTESLADALKVFIDRRQPDSYIALQAFLAPSTKIDAGLTSLQANLREKYKLAVTAAYGPRFLHSTGQLHKGDAGKGLFIQLTADDAQDLAIPEAGGEEASIVTFGLLKEAQALGDRQALLDADRSVIRFHLGDNAELGIARLNEVIGE